MEALILNNIILQVEGATFLVASPMIWVTCPEGCTTEWTYDGTTFTAPSTTASWTDVKDLQIRLLASNTEVAWRIARYKSQKDLIGKETKEDDDKFQDLLQYSQDVRDNDETSHATPQQALDVLNDLNPPPE